MNKITAEEVRAIVGRYWTALNAKALDNFEEFYAPGALVFSSATGRCEPGRLVVARRRREYLHPQTRLRGRTGQVDVLIVSDEVAVAAYSFDFHASHVVAAGDKPFDEDISNGRATQVFARDADGVIRIYHEHLSGAATVGS